MFIQWPYGNTPFWKDYPPPSLSTNILKPFSHQRSGFTIKLHDNDIEAGSCHWIFNWYIFTCFLPRLFMLYSHWIWEWLYFAFLFSFNLRMVFSGTSKYLQTTAFFFICIYTCVIFFTVSGPGGAEPGRARVSSRV